MSILNYTTTISFDKTINEIQKILIQHGATKISIDYENKIPSSVTFGVEINDRMIGFSLPAKYNGVLKAMRGDKNVPRSKCTEEQARRVSWRIVKDWVEAQMALVESELADMAEVFLPYAIKNGTTLYESMKSDNMLLLNK